MLSFSASSAGVSQISGISCGSKTKRKPVPENRALPPELSSGAFSSIRTRSAPYAFAATAASWAALPPPMTTTSYASESAKVISFDPPSDARHP